MPTQSAKDEARKRFEKGLTLLDEEAWGAAIAEFQASLGLFQTRNALRNAGVCYMKLQRFDEALDTYEKLLRSYPTLSADIKLEAQSAVTELRGRVGTVDVTGAEPGATITLDDQSRGEYPPAGPLRVAAGTHVVRIHKEGFETFQSNINVAGGQTVIVEAKLTRLSSSGVLKVSEQGGRFLEVLVDGIAMGTSPWEGRTSVGSHVVILREPGTLGRIGTQPVTSQVKAGEVTTLSLRAQDLDSALRVEPSPPGARVFVDGVDVGAGQWGGRLRSGKHKVEIYKEGFERRTQEVSLVSGGREVISIELKRDKDDPRWRRPSRWVMDVSAGATFNVGRGLGGDIATSCDGTCQMSLTLGPQAMVHVGYELWNGIAFGGAAQYLYTSYDTQDRKSDFQLQPKSTNATTQADVAESTTLQTALLGAFISYEPDLVPVTLRLALGGGPSFLRVDRTGSLPNAGKQLDAVVETRLLGMVFLAPEIRVGLWKLGSLQLTVGAQALVAYLPTAPRWEDRRVTYLDAGPRKGKGNYVDESMTGQALFFFGPTFGLRYGK